MIEQLTLLLATPIAKAIFNKFYKNVETNLINKAIEKLPKRVKQFSQFVWDNYLKEKPNIQELLENASQNSETAQKELTQYLNEVLEDNPDLETEAQKLANEINQNIKIDNKDAENVLNVFDGEGIQNIAKNTARQINISGDNATINVDTK